MVTSPQPYPPNTQKLFGIGDSDGYEDDDGDYIKDQNNSNADDDYDDNVSNGDVDGGANEPVLEDFFLLDQDYNENQNI